MPKLGVFSGRQICGILSGAGYQWIRTRGSHAVMQRIDSDGVS